MILRATVTDTADKARAEMELWEARSLSIDMTRGKPCAKQLDLSNGLEGALDAPYVGDERLDARNYGAPLGLIEARRLVAPILGVPPEHAIVHGTSSLGLMFHYIVHALHFGAAGAGSAWHETGMKPRFLCVVPGYDRHFLVTEKLGFELLPVPLNADGPDMAYIEDLVRRDHSIKGIWCVPKYSNPRGTTYSAEVVERFAKLGTIACPHFRIMWDNAYAVHDLLPERDVVPNLIERCRAHGTENSAIVFGSMSKIVNPGSGMAFAGASRANIEHFASYLRVASAPTGNTNQLRHVRFFQTYEDILDHMRAHAEILRPKFELVDRVLTEGLGERGWARWTKPRGGYFVSLDTLPGLATKVIALCEKAGVKLTPAGSTYPFGRDPHNSNIRIAPTFLDLEQLEIAMHVLVAAIKLASTHAARGRAGIE